MRLRILISPKQVKVTLSLGHKGVYDILYLGLVTYLSPPCLEQSRLNDAAAKAVKDLLPKSAENDLSKVCSWADHVKFIFPWSSALHYIDTPDDLCNYQYNSKILLPFLLVLYYFLYF